MFLIIAEKRSDETGDVIIESDDGAMDESGFQDEDLGYESEETLETLKLRDDLDDDESVATSSSVVEYTIQKDDTLQKISKKFYDSFSQWPKIYELNKDVIDDPDRIKPGTVIQVPVE